MASPFSGGSVHLQLPTKRSESLGRAGKKVKQGPLGTARYAVSSRGSGTPIGGLLHTGVWNPYQVIEVTLKNGTALIAQTRATVSTSDEINCARCHGTDAFTNILTKHDQLHSTTLVSSAPVLCANGTCHTSPALGQSGSGSSGYLSAAIHGAHVSRDAACRVCHTPVPSNTGSWPHEFRWKAR